MALRNPQPRSCRLAVEVAPRKSARTYEAKVVESLASRLKTTYLILIVAGAVMAGCLGESEERESYRGVFRDTCGDCALECFFSTSGAFFFLRVHKLR